MAKWPNVPDCYGWLRLDARGGWRMRDEAAQAADLPGDRIAHEALLGFINRNYLQDAAGRWFFQNGPQRVFVDLEAAPLIAHTRADGQLQLHTGETPTGISGAWFSPAGSLYVQCEAGLALVDDRDLAQCLPQMRLDGQTIDDAALLEWVDGVRSGKLAFIHADAAVTVGRLPDEDVARRFGFVRQPRQAVG